MQCNDCPRKCGVDRREALGFCRESEKIRIARTIENFMWEEPCISGEKGALAIFFSGCNLRCKFCQNYEISHIGRGKTFSPQEFRDYILSFDLTSFSCLDLITPTQFSSQIIKALGGIKLPIPVVWNSSGYESEEVISRLAQIVDVFLVDLKYFSSQLSSSLSSCPDYFEKASKAVKAMAKLKPNVFDGGILSQGVVIRHLILPGHADDSIKVLDFIAQNIADPIVSIMSQFTPTKNSPIKCKLKPIEGKAVVAHAIKLGLTKGYTQDLSSSDENFIPKF